MSGLGYDLYCCRGRGRNNMTNEQAIKHNQASEPRIISLIPSATEILAVLGLTDAIVGRSHECDYPPEIASRPICTQTRLRDATSNAIHNQVNSLLQSALSIYQVKIDTLEELHPTHILTQDQCKVCAVSLSEVEEAAARLIDSSPQIISLQPNTLQDVWDDIERVSQVFQVDSVKVLENLEARVKICQHKLEGLSLPEKPTVVCIEWIDPLMTAANWIPELIELAGGRPLFSIKGRHSARLNWEMLLESNPNIIIFMPCGLDLQRTQQEAEFLSQYPGWKNSGL